MADQRRLSAGRGLELGLEDRQTNRYVLKRFRDAALDNTPLRGVPKPGLGVYGLNTRTDLARNVDREETLQALGARGLRMLILLVGGGPPEGFDGAVAVAYYTRRT